MSSVERFLLTIWSYRPRRKKYLTPRGLPPGEDFLS
jgi:hypothetical protein